MNALVALVVIVSSLLLGGAPAAASGIVVQDVWWFFGDIVQLFNEHHPEVDVDLVIQLELEPPLSQRLLDGTAPDVMNLDPVRYDVFASEGLLYPLDGLMEKYGMGSDVFLPDLSSWRRYGFLYGLPYRLTFGPAVAYNSLLFDEAGLELPAEEWRWQDLLSAGVKLTRDQNGDGNIDFWGISGDLTQPNQWIVFLWQNGGDLYDEERTRSRLNEPQAVETFEFLNALINEYQVVAPVPNPASDQMFVDGRAGLYFLPGHAAVASLENRLSFPWGIEPVPMQRARAIMMGSQQAYAISHHGENPELAFLFIRFVLTNPDAVQRFIASGVIVPATRDGLEAWRLQLGPRASLYDAWLKNVAYGRSFPYDRRWPDVEAILQREIGRIFRGEAAVKEALDRASRQIDAVLATRVAN